jgi:hypothetical protein
MDGEFQLFVYERENGGEIGAGRKGAGQVAGAVVDFPAPATCPCCLCKDVRFFKLSYRGQRLSQGPRRLYAKRW